MKRSSDRELTCLILALGVMLMTLLFYGCTPYDPAREPALRGMNVFPHAATAAAIEEATQFVIDEADLLVYHETDENPGAEAYIAAQFTTSGKPVYVAVGVKAGRNHLQRCRELIALFNPDYFCYAIEANDLELALQAQLPSMYAVLKAENPGLPIFLSLQVTKGYDTAEATALMESSDYWALSTYAFLADGTFRMPPMQDPTGAKPVVIAETGWPAEPLPHPETGSIIMGSPVIQSSYVSIMRTLPIKFFVWFVGRDYDIMWRDSLDQTNPWHRTFRDTGLLDGDGNPRPALDAWRRGSFSIF